MLKIAVVCSHRAPGLLHLLNRDPARGSVYDVVCAVTSEMTFAEEVRVERRGVPTRSHSIHDFYAARSTPIPGERRVRAEYDAAMADILAPLRPDVVLLDGYLYLATAPLLAAYPARLLNLHYADLTIRRPDGRAMFPGIRALRKSLRAGCRTTRATVHIVDEQLDHGAPIVLSRAYPVSPLVQDACDLAAVDMFNAYAFAHEQWMMRTAAGPLWSAALKLISSGDVSLERIAARNPADVEPWSLENDGSISAPPARVHAAGWA